MPKRRFDLRVEKINRLEGVIKAPPSKSYTHRAIIIGSLNGKARITNPLFCDDTLATIKVGQKLGARIYKHKYYLDISGFGGKPSLSGHILNVGESGTLLRLLLPLIALSKGVYSVNGKGTLLTRPNKPIVEALRSWGINIRGRDEDHKLPLKIVGQGRIPGGVSEVSGKISSQTISSLLMVAPWAEEDTTVTIKDKLVSGPYVDITIDVLRWAGIRVERWGWKRFRVKRGQVFKPEGNFVVSGDYSSAAFLMAAAYLINSDLTITDLLKDRQGDRKILTILRQMGANIKHDDKTVRVKGPGEPKGMEIDCSDTPDLVPVLAVLGCFASGRTKLFNLAHLVYKESNRLAATTGELRKLGADITCTDKELFINPSPLHPALVSACNDHRIAMALTVAGLKIGELTIKDAHCISKSYPDFIPDMRALGANLEKIVSG